MGLLSIREGWNSDSRVLSIKCGYPGGRKQWITGFSLMREEGIDCLSLSHHHPDNLSYIFAKGSEYLTCEDGYNRNIKPDHHNVILVDHCYTDASDVNDVYVSSIKQRMDQEGGSFHELEYGGFVTTLAIDGPVILYRGETSGIYPKSLHMDEVSRLLFTDGLSFWVFVDVCRSDLYHQYQLISNTDTRAKESGHNCYDYSMNNGNIIYSVYSDQPLQTRQYAQEIVSVMTTQEPENVCRTSIETLSFESEQAAKEQIFFECFTFAGESASLAFTDRTLAISHGKKKYIITCQKPLPGSLKAVTPVMIRIYDDTVMIKEYQV